MPCEHCQNSGWKRLERDGVEHVVRCDCWREALVGHLLADARIPPRFARSELSTYQPDTDSQRDALRRAKAFVDAFPAVEKGLLFFGPSGVGKSHLAVGVLKDVVRNRGARAYFFETRALLRMVRDTYNRSVEETEMEVLRPVLEAEVLVLDDLGAERTSEWVQETLGLVVNTRYNAKRATIVTSNLHDPLDTGDPNSFMFQVGVRTRSRLLEMCHWVEVQGPDIRDQERLSAAARSGQLPPDPTNIKKKDLPPRAGGMAVARLRDDRSPHELKWTGGKAGS
ncbi:MAG: ATP-binding protein [Acidobacteria bacterium]|nr:ATP-binding protein [Acidobacteriota bacterium]